MVSKEKELKGDRKPPKTLAATVGRTQIMAQLEGLIAFLHDTEIPKGLEKLTKKWRKKKIISEEWLGKIGKIRGLDPLKIRERFIKEKNYLGLYILRLYALASVEKAYTRLAELKRKGKSLMKSYLDTVDEASRATAQIKAHMTYLGSLTPKKRQESLDFSIFPLEIGDAKWPSRGGLRYGARRGEYTTTRGRVRKAGSHKGVDIMARLRDPVRSVLPGIVRKIVKNPGAPGGLAVYVTHKDGSETRYLHLLKIAVKTGQSVKAGEKVGEVGYSGLTKGTIHRIKRGMQRPHLHFAMKIRGRYVNPTKKLDAVYTKSWAELTL